MEVSTVVWFQDIPYQLDLDFQPWRSLRFKGSYGLEGYYLFTRTRTSVLDSGRVTDFFGNPFHLRTEKLPVALKKGTMYASLDMTGLVKPDGSMHTSAATATVQNIPLSTITRNSVNLTFGINERRLSLDRIVYRDEFSELSGRGSADLEELLPLKASAKIRLQGPEGNEQYSSEALIDGSAIRGRLEFASSPVKRLGIEAVNGNLSGSIAVDGTLPKPDLDILLRLNQGRVNLDPLELELAAAYSADAVRIASATAGRLPGSARR